MHKAGLSTCQFVHAAVDTWCVIASAIRVIVHAKLCNKYFVHTVMLLTVFFFFLSQALFKQILR